MSKLSRCLLLCLLFFCVHVSSAAAQFSILHQFGSSSVDAAQPRSTLVVQGNEIYGTTAFGGSADLGSIFKFDTNGSNLQLLHEFSGADGRHSLSGPILVGSQLYGTTLQGGSNNDGTIYRINTDGTSLETLHSFDGGAGGLFGQAQPTFANGVLYGATRAGGAFGNGAVYTLNLDGTGFSVLHDLTDPQGVLPHEVVVDGSSIYSGTVSGGPGDGGAIFRVGTDGTGFQSLKSFTPGGLDGSFVAASPILVGSTLYGTTVFGGADGGGLIYQVETDGTGFEVLHDFEFSTEFSSRGANTRLIASGSSLYGLTAQGGASDNGVIFSIGQDGSDFTVLHDFSGVEGTGTGRLTLDGETLYGTRRFGGQFGEGTLFALSVSVPEPSANIFFLVALLIGSIFRRRDPHLA